MSPFAKNTNTNTNTISTVLKKDSWRIVPGVGAMKELADEIRGMLEEVM